MRPTMLVVILAGCGGAAHNVPASAPSSAPAPIVEQAVPPPTHAAASLEPRSGSTISGTADFEQTAGGVQVVIKVAGAKPGRHGAHLHESGDCSAADAKTAGGHFNPEGTQHGAPSASPHHGGDFGNLEVGADGTGTLTLTSADLTVAPGPKSVIGRAVIVHDGEDDLHSQPAGSSGARAACGVVKAGARREAQGGSR